MAGAASRQTCPNVFHHAPPAARSPRRPYPARTHGPQFLRQAGTRPSRPSRRLPPCRLCRRRPKAHTPARRASPYAAVAAGAPPLIQYGALPRAA
ncbi:hypothetical protein E2C01_100029 [Portunus trituberculatus]|uniref:Uncharacterized protein n=1 Tax=Portunus trituberculatus TaxID=210409 RepID=A0A5B7KGD3_PORTR|nr:hypothetical protein [Portunus trituberculatus]